MHKRLCRTALALTMLILIQSLETMIFPIEASTPSWLEQNQGSARVSRQTSPRAPTIVVPDFSVEIADVKYLAFQVNPSNSELGLHRDDGFHRIKVFWKEFSGCFSYTEDVQLAAKLILADGTERAFNGKLAPAQDCLAGNCFSALAVPGFARDGIPVRYEVQIVNAATFSVGTSDKYATGQFPPSPDRSVDVPPAPRPQDHIGPGSIQPSLKITNVQYASLAGRVHKLNVAYRFSDFTCFSRRAQFGQASVRISLSVKDRKTGVSHTILFNGRLNSAGDCSSIGECLSTVSVPGSTSDNRPDAISVEIQSLVSINGRGIGTRKGRF